MESQLPIQYLFHAVSNFWLIDVWKNNFIYIYLDFACPQGQTFDKDTLGCKNCSAGSFSLGGGHQYTFDESVDLKTTAPELFLDAKSMFGVDDDACTVKK